MSRFIDRTGDTYNRLTVVKLIGKRGRYFEWLCKCQCGSLTEARGCNLQSGNTRSCGCARDTDRVKFSPHGMSGSRTYESWHSMMRRCNDPKRWQYKYYGGRGIKVCKRWMKFSNFLADMGERPSGKTLDRYPNPDGNYSPKNCRWATQKQQMNNLSGTKVLARPVLRLK